jgi:uncharacterized protein YbjT (DUF2867 family)
MKVKVSETKNKNMKIVILGGTGLIGSKVVNLLRSEGHEVIAASPSLVAVARPLNGTVELAGPDAIPFDEVVRQYLAAQNDPRTVVTDEQACYFRHAPREAQSGSRR